MPKFGFYMQDLIPWGQDTHGRYPGEQVGCELALRRRGDGESEVYIKDMVRGGPASLSGALAIGDTIAEINGADPLDASSGAVSSLVKLVTGDMGEPLWLKTAGADSKAVTLVR